MDFLEEDVLKSESENMHLLNTIEWARLTSAVRLSI
jgi:hypothetical protein